QLRHRGDPRARGGGAMTDFAPIDHYLEQNLDRSLAELTRYAAQPSIAAQNVGMEECAEIVVAMLRARGFAVEIVPSEGYPLVAPQSPGGRGGGDRQPSRARVRAPRPRPFERRRGPLGIRLRRPQRGAAPVRGIARHLLRGAVRGDRFPRRALWYRRLHLPE